MKKNFGLIALLVFFTIACGKIPNEVDGLSNGSDADDSLSAQDKAAKAGEEKEAGLDEATKEGEAASEGDTENAAEETEEKEKPVTLEEKKDPTNENFEPEELVKDQDSFCEESDKKLKACNLQGGFGSLTIDQCKGALGFLGEDTQIASAKCLAKGCDEYEPCLRESFGGFGGGNGGGFTGGGNGGGFTGGGNGGGFTGGGNGGGFTGGGNGGGQSDLQKTFQDTQDTCEKIEQRNDACGDPAWGQRERFGCQSSLGRRSEQDRSDARDCLSLDCKDIQACLDKI